MPIPLQPLDTPLSATSTFLLEPEKESIELQDLAEKVANFFERCWTQTLLGRDAYPRGSIPHDTFDYYAATIDVEVNCLRIQVVVKISLFAQDPGHLARVRNQFETTVNTALTPPKRASCSPR